MRKAVWMTLTACLLAAMVIAESPEGPLCRQQGPIQVGEEIALSYESPAFAGPITGSERAWQEELFMPGASYIAPHFRHFVLPPGAELIIRTPDGSRSRTYTRFGKADHELTDGFWGMHMPGDRAVIELRSRVPVAARAVVIDKFAHGYPDMTFKAWDVDRFTKAICGIDDSEWAMCYESTEAGIYNESRAVARLLINGTGACTGWLVGDEGHLMTNNHCIEDSSDAQNTDYEFMAEGATCATNCASWFICDGTVEADTATLIRTDWDLDYTLVELPTNVSGTYGYMQLRDVGALVDERIYIPGHPSGWGKRIAVESTHAEDQSGFCEVYSLNRGGCESRPGPDVGYYCDTQGGSSGSPVLGYSDQLVVALHHCAYCPNRGVPIEDVIADLGTDLPNDAIGTPYAERLWPSSSDGTGCDPNEVWFNYYPCGDWKVYDVTPGSWLGLFAYGDSCTYCVLYYINFQIQENFGSGWQTVETHNPEPDEKGMIYTTSYQPSTDQIRIFSYNGFYVKLYELGLVNSGFETGSSDPGWTVSGYQPAPSITSNDTYVANRGEYSLGNTGSGTYGGVDALLWGYGLEVPPFKIGASSKLYFDTYGATYSQYAHYHVTVWRTSGGTTTYDAYVDYNQGIKSGWRQQVFDFPAAAEGNTIAKVQITFHKDHLTWARYKPTIYIDNISLR